MSKAPNPRRPPLQPDGDDPLRHLLSRAVLGPQPSRRQFLLALGVGVVGVACTRGGTKTSSGPSGSIQALVGATPQLSVLGTGGDAPPMGPGRNRFGFALVDVNNHPIVGGSPQVWLAPDETTAAMGPFPATWHPFTAYEKTGDRSPRSPLPGGFAAEIDFPRVSNWLVAVTVGTGSGRRAGGGILSVTDGPVLAGLGTKAKSTPTPVATNTSAIEEICTRTPVDQMHYISLDDALTNGRPTVACFGTPLLCTSQLCGPVLDEQILAFQEMGKDRANFIHVEEFLPGPAKHPPAATLENLSPAFKAWGLETDPWIFVIDRGGAIRFRALGPITAPEIEAVVQPLL